MYIKLCNTIWFSFGPVLPFHTIPYWQALTSQALSVVKTWLTDTFSSEEQMNKGFFSWLTLDYDSRQIIYYTLETHPENFRKFPFSASWDRPCYWKTNPSFLQNFNFGVITHKPHRMARKLILENFMSTHSVFVKYRVMCKPIMLKNSSIRSVSSFRIR